MLTLSTISSIAHAIAMRMDKANGSTTVHNYLESKIEPSLRHLMVAPLSGEALLEALRDFVASYYLTKDWQVKTSQLLTETPNLRN